MEPRQNDRFSLAKTLISKWWPPIEEADGYSTSQIVEAEGRLGIQLPESMRAWYKYAGRRKDFIGNDDHLLSLDRLNIETSMLLFCVENQGVVQWGISIDDLGSEDPRVLVELIDYPDEVDRDLVVYEWVEGPSRIQWIEADPSFSRFMTGMIVEATLLQAQYSGRGTCPVVWVDAVSRHYRQLPLTTPLTSAQAQLFSDSDTLIEAAPHEVGQVFVMVALRTREAVERLLKVTTESAGECVTLDHKGMWWSHRYHRNCHDVEPLFITTRRSKYRSEDPYYPPCHSMDSGMTALPRTFSDQTHDQD